MDMERLLRNRQQFPPEKLSKYAGKYVAWSPDGDRIIAWNEDETRLDREVTAAGYDPSEVLVSFVPLPDEIVLGGGGA
ncbi:MAG TPA: DUF5678 domain-containing protein [Gemmataceae bacterium]|nr:DUF5678 domain-containing protein [Gemmataceae bacterium]